jgi:hypothetical protein
MSFSFNWAGVNIPTINVAKGTAAEDAAMLGGAVRGYQKREADKEYSEMLKGYQNNDAEIVAEIQRLEARNNEIRRLLGV